MIRQDGDRRYKRYLVPPYAIMNLFMDWNVPAECFSQARIMDVPEGYVIDGIEYSFVYGCYVMLIYHPSFDVVALGEYPPDVISEIKGFYLPKYDSLNEANKSEKDRMMDFFK